MLNQDMTLGERIQTLFREQGITITSVITALGLAIGMIINSILSAAKSIVPPAPTPTPEPTPKPTPKPTPEPAPTPPAGIKGWIKEQLRNIANLLLKLADKNVNRFTWNHRQCCKFCSKSCFNCCWLYIKTSLASIRRISRLIVQLCTKLEFILEFISTEFISTEFISKSTL